MLRLDFKFSRPRLGSTMVREDVKDFINALQKAFPGTVFFNESDKKKGRCEVFRSPLDYVESAKRSFLPLQFRSPTRKDLLDGRPEILSGGDALPLRDITKADLRWAGRFGSIHGYIVPRFEEAIIPVLTTKDFDLVRWRQGSGSGFRHWDTEDSTYHRAQQGWSKSLRVFDTSHGGPGISFIFAAGNREMIDYIKTIRGILSSLLVKSYCTRDLDTGEMVKVFRSIGWGISKRIMHACAFDENLFHSIHSDGRRNVGIGPTDSYIAKARKRAGSPA